MTHCIVGAFLLLFDLWPAMGQNDSLVAIDVCEVAHRLSAFRNKIVAIRGEFLSGRHGATVARAQCSSPSPFKEFGSGLAINLAFPSDDTTEESRVGRQVDRDSLRRFERAISDAGDRSEIGSQFTVVATFVGTLRVRAGFKLKREPNGGYDGNGYGHLGRYPAELVLWKVTDVQITPGTHR